MIDRPIDRHRSTIDGESTYHIREIPHLFVVGQTLPHKAAVPGVKSKDMGAYKKERLLYLIQTALRQNGGTLETGQITRYYQDRDAGKLKVGTVGSDVAAEH
jgi:transcription initiation factor TFIID subunit 1, fungi type